MRQALAATDGRQLARWGAPRQVTLPKSGQPPPPPRPAEPTKLLSPGEGLTGAEPRASGKEKALRELRVAAPA